VTAVSTPAKSKADNEVDNAALALFSAVDLISQEQAQKGLGPKQTSQTSHQQQGGQDSRSDKYVKLFGLKP
jgi:hypothetical protein